MPWKLFSKIGAQWRKFLEGNHNGREAKRVYIIEGAKCVGFNIPTVSQILNMISSFGGRVAFEGVLWYTERQYSNELPSGGSARQLVSV